MAAQNQPAAETQQAETTTTELARPRTAEDVVEAQRKEYGQYVAKEPIYHGNALAYNPLDPVPVSNVEHHGYLDKGLVVKTGSKAHEDLRKQILGL